MAGIVSTQAATIFLAVAHFTEDTPLEGAELIFAWQEAELFCSKCKENFVKIKSNLECPKCQTQGLQQK